jgi:predicted AAA+ superfamily ATPase
MSTTITDTVSNYHINRYLSDTLLEHFVHSNAAKGLILAGVVGVGKTTLIEKLCSKMELLGYQILRFEGDDIQFRMQVKENTKTLIEKVQEAGLTKPFLFVDEVQKSPEIFDAIKMYFDKLQAPFIVSGSNPAYLRTTANDRLQRRAGIKTLFPLSLPEILLHDGLISKFDLESFLDLVWRAASIHEIQLPTVELPAAIYKTTSRYMSIGGLPQAHLASSLEESLGFIQLIAERGITSTYDTVTAVDDEIRRELALQNAKEFSYQGAHQRLRSTKRQTVDRVITHLMNHGYLFKKRPYLLEYEREKSTYFSTYSWIDSGIVSYYTAKIQPSPQEAGFRLESYIHTRLISYLECIPLKTALYYYKPFSLKPSNQSFYFKPGEIDFVIVIGDRQIPIEVKMGSKLAEIDTELIEQYVKEQKSCYGIILYGGAPHCDTQRKLIYYPYWLI